MKIQILYIRCTSVKWLEAKKTQKKQWTFFLPNEKDQYN